MAGYTCSLRLIDCQTQKWWSYQVQFKQFLIVNNIKTDQKKTLSLITLIGKETYEILEGPMFSSKPAELTIATLFQKLANHISNPSDSKLRRSAHCGSTNKGHLNDYISEIQKLASTCQFPQEYLQDTFTTAFVLGLRDENISSKLLTETGLTLAQLPRAYK